MRSPAPRCLPSCSFLSAGSGSPLLSHPRQAPVLPLRTLVRVHEAETLQHTWVSLPVSCFMVSRNHSLPSFSFLVVKYTEHKFTLLVTSQTETHVP